MAYLKCDFTVVDMINTLLDVVVEHGNLPIHCEAPVTIEIAKSKQGEYAILSAPKE